MPTRLGEQKVKINLLALAKALVFSALSVITGLAQAAFSDCTLSGQAGVVRDINSNNIPDGPVAGGDAVYIMQYDPDTNQARYFWEDVGGRFLVDTSSVSQSTDIVGLPGFGVIFYKLLGNPVFNQGQYTHPRGQGTACGTLVDSDNDGLADRLVLQMSMYNAAPAVLMDHVLQFYPSAAAATHWWLPNPFPYAPSLFGAPSAALNIGQAYFAPVDLGNQNMVVSCPGLTTPFVTSLATNAIGPGPCPLAAAGDTRIPTVSFWGYAALALLLMVAGIRMLRHRGFGDDFNFRL